MFKIKCFEISFTYKHTDKTWGLEKSYNYQMPKIHLLLKYALFNLADCDTVSSDGSYGNG